MAREIKLSLATASLLPVLEKHSLKNSHQFSFKSSAGTARIAVSVQENLFRRNDARSQQTKSFVAAVRIE
jgi:hypothetical protein